MQVAPQRQSYQPQTSFKGLRSKDSRALLALDLDGTFAHGTNEDIQRVLDLAKKTNAIIAYVTGRTPEKVEKLRATLSQKNIILPPSGFSISRNGLQIYDNKFIEDKEWLEKCTSSFEEKRIIASVNEFSLKRENIMPYARHKKQPILKDSKLCPYSFWPVPNMISFICDASLSEKIENLLHKKLTTDGIQNFRITRQIFTKKICDEFCNAEQLEIINPRYSKDFKSTQIDITAANKADGVRYLAQKLSIPKNEILMAGDDLNDISMAHMVNEGSFFVRVANCVEEFRTLTAKIKDKNPFNMILATKEGAAGIAEGIETVLAKFRPDLNN